MPARGPNHFRTIAGSSKGSSTAIGPALPGATFHARVSGPGRRYGSATAATPPTAPGQSAILSRRGRWHRLERLRRRRHQSCPPARDEHDAPWPGHRGATSNCKYLPVREREPAGHGIGRSRGGLPTKFHQAVDGKGWLLAVVVTSEQRPDGVILPQVLADIRVPRTGDGRPRACPYAVLADRAYGSRGKREYLRSRGVRAVTPGKWGPDRDLEKTRQQRWTAPEFDAGAYRNRNLLERSFSYVKQWRGLATVRLTCHHLPGGSRDQRGPDKAPPIMETCPSGGLLRRGPYPEGVTFLAVGTPWIVSPTIYHLSAQRRLPRPCAIRVKIMHRSCNTPASFFSQRAARPLRCRGFDDC